jgi:hypothetical protein
MTLEFDSLQKIFGDLENGRNLEFKEKAELLAEKTKKEIEQKVEIKPRIRGLEGLEKWEHYFSEAHEIDHSPKWHHKLISPKTINEITQLEQEMKS